ncbi:hypothetical protein BDW02DRAFT_568595 [Decorospora gaudefroyi]|uniref:Uncharacterized protein n=1 Tax=Decorospora gaudefroyi TaxID=184978 RepID=A0A6A5KH20_9PLEO|nr:hypothetical protein BDW02DRAFT_568595 [Decorospora gaudefroyi]
MREAASPGHHCYAFPNRVPLLWSITLHFRKRTTGVKARDARHLPNTQVAPLPGPGGREPPVLHQYPNHVQKHQASGRLSWGFCNVKRKEKEYPDMTCGYLRVAKLDWTTEVGLAQLTNNTAPEARHDTRCRIRAPDAFAALHNSGGESYMGKDWVCLMWAGQETPSGLECVTLPVSSH